MNNPLTQTPPRQARNAISLPDARGILTGDVATTDMGSLISLWREQGIDLTRPVVELAGKRVLEALIINGAPASTVRAAIDAGAPAAFRNGYRESMLLLAISRRSFDIANVILDSGQYDPASLAWLNRDGSEDAYLACARLAVGSDKATELLDRLYQLGASPLIQNASGMSAPMWVLAKSKGDRHQLLSTVAQILDHAGDLYRNQPRSGVEMALELKDNEGQNLAYYLVSFAARDKAPSGRRDFYGEALRALIPRGLDIDAPDKRGYTALLWSSIYRLPELTDVLIQLGANVSAENTEGDTPTGMAAHNGDIPTLQALLNAGADPDQSDPEREHKAPILRAANAGNWEAVDLLAAYGADVDVSDPSNDDHTLLIKAIKALRPEMVRKLIEYGADIDRLNSHRISPLMYGVFHYPDDPEKGREIIDSLVSAGATLNSRMQDGRSLVDILEEQGRIEDLGQLIYMRNVAYIADNFYSGDFEQARHALLEEGSSSDYHQLFHCAVENRESFIAYVGEKSKARLMREQARELELAKLGSHKLLGMVSTLAAGAASSGHLLTEALAQSEGSLAGAGVVLAASAAKLVLDYSPEDRVAMQLALRDTIEDIRMRIIDPSLATLRKSAAAFASASLNRVHQVFTKWSCVVRGLSALSSILENPRDVFASCKRFLGASKAHEPRDGARCSVDRRESEGLGHLEDAMLAFDPGNMDRDVSLLDYLRRDMAARAGSPDLPDEAEVKALMNDLVEGRAGADRSAPAVSTPSSDESEGPSP